MSESEVLTVFSSFIDEDAKAQGNKWTYFSGGSELGRELNEQSMAKGNTMLSPLPFFWGSSWDGGGTTALSHRPWFKSQQDRQ